MPILNILVGPPGSGKTTWRKNLQQGYIEISQDEQGKENHLLVFNVAIAQDNDIIVDRMNFDKKQRARYIEVAKKKGYQIHCVVFYTPKSLCLSRSIARKDHPTIKDEETAIKAINFFFAHYEKPEPTEGIDTFELVYPGLVHTECIVVDLDGTLCNIDHRLHHVRNKPKRWDLFFKGIPEDKPNKWCQEIIKSVWNGNPTVEIVLCSGRGEEYRKVSQKWLEIDKDIPYTELFMRPAGDSRPDDIVKETILDFDILPQYNPLFFIDDRKRVVDMWRRRGFTCLQCAEGNF